MSSSHEQRQAAKNKTRLNRRGAERNNRSEPKNNPFTIHHSLFTTLKLYTFFRSSAAYRVRIALNAKKYPVDKARGKATKYNKL